MILPTKRTLVKDGGMVQMPNMRLFVTLILNSKNVPKFSF